MITLEDFKKLNIVIGTVLTAEAIADSEKLIKFQIALGTETRQIIGGLKTSYQPLDLIGKQVLVLANLAPRSLMGLESQGMILAASDPTSKPIIISPLSPVPNGTEIK